jgi:hypothetical protein
MEISMGERRDPLGSAGRPVAGDDFSPDDLSVTQAAEFASLGYSLLQQMT